ncbi:MAG: triosephosphate isomerase TIM [archaeon GW2011_AR13]|nr:MAG: triosephosphate isomerase TIM [archaeon GW2011_AR13]HIG94655.1 triose-phosphate isomerase [Nanoarchaeota archaeon]HIH63451.1 triose-phosphate isomerase [Nanoarchaeota archaeon]HIJ09381.1 triose-phosphate isomerase [Nanoarchaeota archaeon]
MKPIIIINLKTYKQGKKVLELAKIIEKVNKKIIVGAQPEDVAILSKKTNLSIYSQHVDYQEPGRNTGFILPEGIKAVGAKGVFLNHSEHRLDFKIIKKTVLHCKKVKLKVAIFAKDLRQAKKIKELKPDFLIIEPPELVAGEISVSKAKPELIKKIGRELKYPFIVGAGIKTNDDLKIAMKLGARGIAVSSAITQARNPEKSLREMVGK